MASRHRAACRLLALAAAGWLSTLVPGCSLDRSGLGPRAGDALDASSPGLDAAGIDAWTPMGVDSGTLDPIDAWTPAPDAGPRPCAPACTEGRVCVDGACVCPAGACCPGCVDGRVCSSGVCECPVGSCCPACPSALVCMSGSCVTPPPCGAEGEPCCPGDACDAADLVCWGGGILEPPRACVGCGTTNDRCCSGGTCANADDYCDIGGSCRRCGSFIGARCCSGDSCDGGRTCRFGFCS